MMAEKATDLGGEQNVITNFTVLWIFAVVEIFVVLSCFIFLYEQILFYSRSLGFSHPKQNMGICIWVLSCIVSIMSNQILLWYSHWYLPTLP